MHEKRPYRGLLQEGEKDERWCVEDSADWNGRDE